MDADKLKLNGTEKITFLAQKPNHMCMFTAYESKGLTAEDYITLEQIRNITNELQHQNLANNKKSNEN